MAQLDPGKNEPTGKSAQNSAATEKALKQIQSMLPGEWIFERHISEMPVITGTASFTPNGSNLHYREEVRFPVKTGKTLNAHREYLYSFENGALNIYFADGKEKGSLFLPLQFEDVSSLSSLTACGSHLCVEDMYEGKFTFNPPDAFSVTYLVKGPNKDYTIESRYTR